MKRIALLLGIVLILILAGCIEHNDSDFKQFCQSRFACGPYQYYNAVSFGDYTDQKVTCVCKIEGSSFAQDLYIRIDYTIHKDNITQIEKGNK